MRARIAARRCQRLDDVRRRGQIRIADAEVDEVASLLALFVLERVDLREQVGRQLSDAVGQLDLHDEAVFTTGTSARRARLTPSADRLSSGPKWPKPPNRPQKQPPPPRRPRPQRRKAPARRRRPPATGRS